MASRAPDVNAFIEQVHVAVALAVEVYESVNVDVTSTSTPPRALDAATRIGNPAELSALRDLS